MADGDIKHGSEKQAEECDSEHPEEDGGPEGLAHFGAGAAGQHERKHAEDEGEAGHEDGAKPEAAGFDGGMGAVPGGGNPGQLAHGISIALYNTAFGLIVAIPALIFWRYFRARVDDYLLSMELAAERFARHLVSLRK